MHFIYKKKLTTVTGTTGSNGPGGPVATVTPTKPIVVDKPILKPVETTPEPTSGLKNEDGKNIFNVPMIGAQCINIVKNLDEPRLVKYYQGTLDIAAGRKVHKDVTR